MGKRVLQMMMMTMMKMTMRWQYVDRCREEGWARNNALLLKQWYHILSLHNCPCQKTSASVEIHVHFSSSAPTFMLFVFFIVQSDNRALALHFLHDLRGQSTLVRETHLGRKGCVRHPFA